MKEDIKKEIEKHFGDFLRIAFNLSKQPVYKRFCCDGDTCIEHIVADAQAELEAGNPVVLALLGRPVANKEVSPKLKKFFGTEVLSEGITNLIAFIPGQKIDINFVKQTAKLMMQETFGLSLDR